MLEGGLEGAGWGKERRGRRMYAEEQVLLDIMAPMTCVLILVLTDL